MNISENTNVSGLIASSISKLNLNSVKKPNINFGNEKPQTKENLIPKIKEEEKNLVEEKPRKTVDVEDIQKYAKMVGENISVDDINYGIMYGRSVIADYIA